MADTARTPESNRMPLLAKPHIRLYGQVDEAMYAAFRDQLKACPSDGPLAVAITTLGGNPEIARAMADDVRLLREHDRREILFLGKVAVYSAGTVLMAAFPIADRYLTRDTRLMLHERSLEKTLELSGPLKAALAQVRQVLHQIEESIRIEEEGFRAVVDGSNVTFEEVRDRAPDAWYIDCREALRLGLIAGVV